MAPSAVRGTFYGIAAGIGKIGAFSGTYAYPEIQADLAGPKGEDANIYFAGPFYIASGLAILSAIIVFFCIPPVVQDGMHKIDAEFHGECVCVFSHFAHSLV